MWFFVPAINIGFTILLMFKKGTGPSDYEASKVVPQQTFDEKLMKELRLDIKERATEELEKIWKQREKLNPKYYIETYKVIQEILIERGKFEQVLKCWNHSESEASVNCIYCGRDLCMQCFKKRKESNYCCRDNDGCLSHQNQS